MKDSVARAGAISVVQNFINVYSVPIYHVVEETVDGSEQVFSNLAMQIFEMREPREDPISIPASERNSKKKSSNLQKLGPIPPPSGKNWCRPQTSVQSNK